MSRVEGKWVWGGGGELITETKKSRQGKEEKYVKIFKKKIFFLPISLRNSRINLETEIFKNKNIFKLKGFKILRQMKIFSVTSTKRKEKNENTKA